uniref:Mitochondrial import inner membrane translocase subunit TIM50 n=1 Tax=Ananas comosus var. bracteatus TaxID=296719 RepID=A0A6V7NLE2_ANACO|nr:unnamed protein product [Ananas comosus var. bracteatus]
MWRAGAKWAVGATLLRAGGGAAVIASSDDPSTSLKICTIVPLRLYRDAVTAAVIAFVPVKAIELFLDIRTKVEKHVRDFTEPSSDKLLPDLLPEEQYVYTLVLDLIETLVYSNWQRDRGWRTFKRPGVEGFLEHLAKFYEIVVHSDQLNMYVDPVVERLDQKGCIRLLSRAATKYQNGKHYRPKNCVPIKPWKLENDDTALLDLLPFLEFVAVHRPADIRSVLASYQGRDIATEFIERSKEYKRLFVSQGDRVLKY